MKMNISITLVTGFSTACQENSVTGKMKFDKFLKIIPVEPPFTELNAMGRSVVKLYH